MIRWLTAQGALNTLTSTLLVRMTPRGFRFHRLSFLEHCFVSKRRIQVVGKMGCYRLGGSGVRGSQVARYNYEITTADADT